MYKITKINNESKKAKRRYKIILIVICIIILPIIIANIVMIVKTFINPHEIPDFFGYKNFIIVSGSMNPTIKIGDAIITKEVTQDEIKLNDIISFHQGKIITTHRVIEIIEIDGVKKYRTKGDHNKLPDKQLVSYEEIEGKVQFKSNILGNIIELLRKKSTITILIIIVILCYINSYRIERRKFKRSKIRKMHKETK